MKKIIYLIVAVLTVSMLAGCGCSNGKKPHPNVIITTEEPAPEYCGSWESKVKAGDGEEYTLNLDLNPDGNARYEAISSDGEVIVNAQGTWSKTDTMIILDLYDTVENIIWRANFDYEYDGTSFALTNSRGKAFIEGTEADTIVFTRK